MDFQQALAVLSPEIAEWMRKDDQHEYAVLVNRVRAARGLAPLANVLPVDHPRYYIRQMESQLEQNDE